jgi:hypothetical protein
LQNRPWRQLSDGKLESSLLENPPPNMGFARQRHLSVPCPVPWRNPVTKVDFCTFRAAELPSAIGGPADFTKIAETATLLTNPERITQCRRFPCYEFTACQQPFAHFCRSLEKDPIHAARTAAGNLENSRGLLVSLCMVYVHGDLSAHALPNRPTTRNQLLRYQVHTKVMNRRVARNWVIVARRIYPICMPPIFIWD